MGPLRQVSRTVSNVDRAVEWYGDELGWSISTRSIDVAFVDCDGTRLFLSAVENVGNESVLYFRVDDISASYDNLRSRGVEFEDAPPLIFPPESGMEEWMAFFNAPDDHLTAIMAQVGSE